MQNPRNKLSKTDVNDVVIILQAAAMGRPPRSAEILRLINLATGAGALIMSETDDVIMRATHR